MMVMCKLELQCVQGTTMGEGPICQGHKYPQEQRLKEMFKFNFQIRNKTKLCNSKTKTQKQKIRT